MVGRSRAQASQDLLVGLARLDTIEDAALPLVLADRWRLDPRRSDDWLPVVARLADFGLALTVRVLFGVIEDEPERYNRGLFLFRDMPTFPRMPDYIVKEFRVLEVDVSEEDFDRSGMRFDLIKASHIEGSQIETRRINAVVRYVS